MVCVAGASTSNPKFTGRAPKTAPTASKRRKIAVESGVSGKDGNGSGSDDDSDLMEPEQPIGAPSPAPKGKGASTSSKKMNAGVPAAKVSSGKVTRARTSKPAAGPPDSPANSDVEMLGSEDSDEALANRGMVGGKRKRGDPDAGVGGDAPSKGKPRAAKGATKAKAKGKKSKMEASDSEGDSDWDPGSDDEKQQQADEVESSDDGSVVEEEEVVEGMWRLIENASLQASSVHLYKMCYFNGSRLE